MAELRHAVEDVARNAREAIERGEQLRQIGLEAGQEVLVEPEFWFVAEGALVSAGVGTDLNSDSNFNFYLVIPKFSGNLRNFALETMHKSAWTSRIPCSDSSSRTA